MDDRKTENNNVKPRNIDRNRGGKRGMIERKQVMPVNFLKKENFTGSDRGMRYRMEKGERDGEAILVVTVWPEPYGFDATPEEDKISNQFSFSEEGIQKGVEWLNQMKRERFGGEEEQHEV